MQMCLGATYSWSIYVAALREQTGVLQGTVQVPFTLFYLFFSITMIFSGSLVAKLGPQICAVSGGFLFGSGWLLASLGKISFGWTIAGIGIIGGIGVGLAYVVPITTCMLWFPKHRGLVTGAAVAGFGGGAALVSLVAGYLMGNLSMTPFQAFAILGLSFVVLICSAGWTMINPPSVTPEAQHLLPLRRLFRQPVFAVLYGGMFLGLAAGFTINANLKDLGPQGLMKTGIAAVSIFAIANALGRVVWGTLIDRLSCAAATSGNLLSQALVLFLSLWLLRHPKGFLVFAFLTGFNYGGVLVLYVSSVAHIWGSGRVGQVYGWIFSSNILAAIFPMFAGYIYDLTGSFQLVLWGVSALLLLMASCMWRGRKMLEPLPSE
jgi:OFA family oxalate/formate antiporter-like MFS transporter